MYYAKASCYELHWQLTALFKMSWSAVALYQRVWITSADVKIVGYHYSVFPPVVTVQATGLTALSEMLPCI